MILACATLGQAEEFETTIRSSPPKVEINDPKRGIFVAITKHEDNTPDGFSYSHSSDVIEIEGVRYSVSTSKSDESTEEIRIRLREDTLGHLITDRKEHDFLRFIAIRDLPKAKLDHKTTVELLSKAAREPKALLRSMAAKTIPDIKPRKDVIHLLVELLMDPCIDVAHGTLFPLIDHYSLKEPSGECPHVTTFWRSRAVGLYHHKQQEVLRVAELLRTTDPKLVSLKDLVAIRSREVPSKDWYLDRGWSEAGIPAAKQHFRENFLKKKDAEQ